MSFVGHVHNGVVVFETPIPLPEGTAVTVSPQTMPAPEQRREDEEAAPPQTPLKWYEGLIGCLDLPEDASLNVDHYLYGHPKVTNPAKSS
jgi:hypothetical protein